MSTQSLILMCCAFLLAAVTAADAAKKRPDPGSNVTCECQCRAETGDDTVTIETKHIGGERNWKGSRAQCREFSKSRCTIEDGGGSYVGELGTCDTIVHRLPPGQMQELETVPSTTGETAPGQSGGTKRPSKILDLPLKLQRSTD